MLVRAHGIEIDLPGGWEGRVYRRPEGQPILHAGNFALPAEDSDFGGEAIKRMHREGVFVVLAEHGPDAVGQPLFAPEGIPLPLRAEDANPRAFERLVPGRAGIQKFFSHAGRPFCLYVVIATGSPQVALWSHANDVLGSVRIAAGGSS
jgi:hypothetical protein